LVGRGSWFLFIIRQFLFRGSRHVIAQLHAQFAVPLSVVELNHIPQLGVIGQLFAERADFFRFVERRLDPGPVFGNERPAPVEWSPVQRWDPIQWDAIERNSVQCSPVQRNAIQREPVERLVSVEYVLAIECVFPVEQLSIQ
jgi:hypothetical protein